MFPGIKTCNPKLKRKGFSCYLHTPRLIFLPASMLKERENVISYVIKVQSLKKKSNQKYNNF